MISGLVAKTVRISCSLHADRANSITRFFGTHLVGAAVEFLQSSRFIAGCGFNLSTVCLL
jgi:hypothetical protein